MGLAQASGNPAHRNADRLLAYAIAISLLAHALILALAPGWLDPKRNRASTPPPLVAHLVQPKPAPAPVVERTPQLTPSPEAPRKPTPVERVQPKLVAPPSASTTPAPTIAPQPAPAPEPPRSTEPVQLPLPPVTVPSARIEPAPTPPAAPATSDSADPATLGEYRIAIITAAKRYKRYPRIAIDNNWEGQAEVRMAISADGSIASLTIKTRSGFEALDQQALEMIRKAKPLTPIPASLRGRGFTVDVPVVFSLKEETG